MRRLFDTMREHRHFFIVVTLLTLVMTFPTIIYVFKTDVFWLPTGNTLEVFIELWDIWYTKLIVSGQEDRSYTNLIYYPEGVSLAYDPKFFLFNSIVNLFQVIMPLSNAYCLAFLLLIGTTALAGYSYALWIFKDKWIALLAAAILALSPQVLAHAHWIKIAWIGQIPIFLYFAHRGIVERRASLVVLAGVLSGFLGGDHRLQLYLSGYYCGVTRVGVGRQSLARATLLGLCAATCNGVCTVMLLARVAHTGTDRVATRSTRLLRS